MTKLVMSKLMTLLASVVVLGLLVTAGAPAAVASDSCPNAALRVGPSAALPDCRAYELVSPDLNHALVDQEQGGASTADGETMVYAAIDAPEHASSSQPASNRVRATRNAVTGWRGVSLSPPIPGPIDGYNSFQSSAISADLSSTFERGDLPLSGGPVPSGINAYVARPDGTYRLLTAVGAPNFQGGFVAGNADFSQVYFTSPVAQLSSDPTGGGNTYLWTEEGGLDLVGVLPDGTAAASGASLVGSIIGPISADAHRAVFLSSGELYLHIDGAPTVDLGGPVNIDPSQTDPTSTDRAGISTDGSTVLFTSRAELTGDANTGPSQTGRDLYSYDVHSGHLSDLTVDAEPADAATGANVGYVAAASPDGAYVYFTATGDLAEGATPGHTSLYVWHNGLIGFVASADGIPNQAPFYVTPDGRHFVFDSTASLTGYDNADPTTGQPHMEVFKATFGAGIECVSCRADGTRPTGDSAIRVSSSLGGRVRVASDDGARVFFVSTDAVVPQASSGLQQVFEHEAGKVTAISRLDSSAPAFFLQASATGNDVFFATFDDLVPNPNGGDSAVFDARVGGGFSTSTDEDCSTMCRGPATPAPERPIAASITFLGNADGQQAPKAPTSTAKVTVSKVKPIIGTAGSLRVEVPGKGRLTVSGAGLRTRRSSLSKAQTLTVRLALTSNAARLLRRHRSLKIKARLAYSGAGGITSSVTVSVTFMTGSTRGGRSS